MPIDFDTLKPAEEAQEQPSEHLGVGGMAEGAALAVPRAAYDLTVGNAINAGQAIGSVVKDGMHGSIPGSTLAKSAWGRMQDSAEKAKLAFASGDHVAGWAHSMASVVPMLGAMGEDTVRALHDGYTQNDPVKFSEGLSNGLQFMAPELAGAASESKLGKLASDHLMHSAAGNYLDTMLPLKHEYQYPQAVRASQKIAETTSPIAMTRKGLASKLGAAANNVGEDIGEHLDVTNNPGAVSPTKPLHDMLDKYAMDRYTTTLPDGRKVPANMGGFDLVKDLHDSINKWQQRQAGTPGLVAPGQMPPQSSTQMITHDAVNTLRKQLENGTLERDGSWKDKIDPNSLAKLDRAHAGVLRDYLSQQDPDLGAMNSAYEAFSKGKEFLTRADNAKNYKGTKDIPIYSSVRKGQIPQAINNSMANVPWNTVAGSTKAALSRSIASGNWTKATRILQLTRVGVPVPDDGDDK